MKTLQVIVPVGCNRRAGALIRGTCALLANLGKYEAEAARGRWSSPRKIVAPRMVYISGEEMTRYTMDLILQEWIRPHVDISKWQFYDLSCKSRDDTDDQVLRDAVAAGAEIGSIFKEPTITPTVVQQKELGLKKAWGSPNGAMRRGWNGITISRDTIHIDGVELGFKNQVLFDRHAVGGEYGAGWKSVGKGRLMTTFFPDDPDAPPVIVDARTLHNDNNVAVVYDNPLDNVAQLAEIFFERCLAANVIPYVVTKKTVFKWQEPFWSIHKRVFDEKYKDRFAAAGLLESTGGELMHLISDAATMQIIRWTRGGFGMSAHNYDGDMLTDEISQVHRSPGFITSNLVGRAADGRLIKEFEASHGTVADLWQMHLKGEETSMNPLGMADALICAMKHSGELIGGTGQKEMNAFCSTLKSALHNSFRYGQGTRDMAGPKGLTTEAFVGKVGWRLGRYLAQRIDRDEDQDHTTEIKPSVMHIPGMGQVDAAALDDAFRAIDVSGEGRINADQFKEMIIKLGMAPRVDPRSRSSASLDQPSKQREGEAEE